MKLVAMRQITVRLSEGVRSFQAGESFEIPDEKAEKARPYIEQGIFKPVREQAAPPTEKDPFSEGFNAVSATLRGAFEYWGVSDRKAEIMAALDRLDTAWNRGNLILFNAIVSEIDRLVYQAFVEDFKKRGIAVRIKSRILGEDVWLCSSESVREHLNAEGLACYLPEEIEKMKGLSEKALKAVNEAKKGFPGAEIIETEKRGKLD